MNSAGPDQTAICKEAVQYLSFNDILDTSPALKGKHSGCRKDMSHTNILEKILI